MKTITSGVDTGFAQPFFARRERLDAYEHLRVRTFGQSELVACQVRRDQPGLGLTQPHSASATFLASIFLGRWADGDIWCDERHLRRTSTAPNGLGIVDLRHSWVADLQEPFAALHLYIPLRAFNELTDDMHVSPIETLVCPIHAPKRDDVMLHLMMALMPALSNPSEANSLFAEYIFSAMKIHLAQTYGGLVPPSERIIGGLAPWQEQRVKEMLLDDLQTSVHLEDLASVCRMSARHFSRAFKSTTGLPPHRWLLRQRVERAKALLKFTKRSLSEIALVCGFADQSHLTRVFHASTGCSPGAWRRKSQ